MARALYSPLHASVTLLKLSTRFNLLHLTSKQNTVLWPPFIHSNSPQNYEFTTCIETKVSIYAAFTSFSSQYFRKLKPSVHEPSVRHPYPSLWILTYHGSSVICCCASSTYWASTEFLSNLFIDFQRSNHPQFWPQKLWISCMISSGPQRLWYLMSIYQRSTSFANKVRASTSRRSSGPQK